MLVVFAAATGGLIWGLSGSRRSSAVAPPSQSSLNITTSNTTRANPEPSLSEAEQDKALRREQTEAAEKLLAEFPDNDDAVYLAGLVCEEQGDTAKAIQLWERSLELDPGRADAHDSLGHAWMLRDDYEKAETYLRKALALDTNLHSARFHLAGALSYQGKLEEVIAVLTNGTTLSADACRLLGDAYLHLKDYPKAQANFETAIKLNPELAEGYYGLSKVWTFLENREKSAEYLEKFNALKKKTDTVERHIRATFAPLKISMRSTAQTHTDVGRVYMKKGRHREAEAMWRRAAALDPENSLCRLQLAVLCHQTGNSGEALRYYEEVAKLDPTDGLVQLNLGRVCAKLRQFERAEQAFKEVLKLAPSQAEGYSGLADLYLQSNRNLAQARLLAEQAVKLTPDAQNFGLLGQACIMNGDRPAAVAAMNKALELEPGNPHYLQMLQRLLEKR